MLRKILTQGTITHCNRMFFQTRNIHKKGTDLFPVL